jgi:5S rRNA maturation endonuclease (ribonuclease M5)
MHVVRSSRVGGATSVIIAEGETDGALLSRLCPDYDIAILPAGAKHFSDTMATQVSAYAEVLVGTDADEAGDAGASRIMDMVPSAMRLRPPEGAKDWCEAHVKGLLESPFTPVGTPRPRLPVFSIRELLDADLGTDEENNWFESPIAPVGGEVVIHGPMKSYKSIILVEMLRAMATGTSFADYAPFARSDGPGRVLLFQFEVRPQQFQKRIRALTMSMTAAEETLFLDNFSVYGLANREMPRLRMNRTGFQETILAAVEACGADVVAFDPVQRMAGGANINHADELDQIFTLYETLMDTGLTVVYTHHDNKATRGSGDAYSMSGSQRFGADADSICSVYKTKDMPDYERNIKWTLRNGHASDRSIRVHEDSSTGLMVVHYDDPSAPAAAPAVSSAGLPSIT